METRHRFVKLNGLAMVVIPLIVIVGRFMGQNGGWFLFAFVLGGFLVVSIAYLILLLVARFLPRGSIRSPGWLYVLWAIGCVGTTIALLAIPDVGDAPNSGTFLGPPQ